MTTLKQFFQKLFGGKKPTRELVCLPDENGTGYMCWEVKQGALVQLPGGPYSKDECEIIRQQG